MTVRALAIDFGGTLARPGPNPDGTTVATAIGGLPDTVLPDGFAAAFGSGPLSVVTVGSV